jgi:hypothetical protein
MHENDEVEGTSYTILQARDYVRATGDHEFGREMWPMLEWCWDVQQGHLSLGLLPFNGDETYVAGGYFPRSGLLHGSADSTLVFIEAGKWLADWAVSQNLWTQDYAERQLSIVDESRQAYRRFFFDKDRVWANAPERENAITPPRFRHGVCEAFCGLFGWTQRTPTGRYVCPTCFGSQRLPEDKPPPTEVNSVSLLPAYLGSDLLCPEEMRAVLDRVIGQQNESGHIPSVPGTTGCVGYDPGLILINLVALGHPYAKRAYERILEMSDQTGAYNEYYDAADRVRKDCCRARPWESGVNAEAIVAYLLGRVPN